MKFALISSNDASYKPLADITWTGKEKYCRKHGYTAIHFLQGDRTEESKVSEGHNQWYGYFKLQCVVDTLETGKFDWVFFSESDALITNLDIRLEDIVAQADRKFDMLLSSNFDGLNMGNFFVKNTTWAKEFLKLGISLRSKYAHRGYAEQQYFMDVFPTNQDHIKVMPQKLFNSHDHFLYEHFKVPQDRRKDMLGNPGQWELGDFQLHWCGFDIGHRLKFAEFYKDKIVDTSVQEC